MKPDHIFLALTVVSFLASCVFYKLGRKIGGDRLLYLAYGMVFCGWLAALERWGVLP